MLRPNFAAVHNNLGTALKNKGLLAGAIDAFGRAIQLDPGYDEARWNRALTLLLCGDFQNGWREHESRLRTPIRVRRLRRESSPQPQWDGGELHGRTIFLHPEQGLGDTLQFVRYVPLVAQRGGRVILGCAGTDAPVHGFSWRCANRLDGPAIARFRCPMPAHESSAGVRHRSGLDSRDDSLPLPGPVPREDWKRKIDANGSVFKIGLAWAGNPENPHNRLRSIALFQLSPLAEASKQAAVQFHSLQKGEAAPQALPAGMDLIDWTRDLHDFAETAALIANLDLVITVDTAVAHLAGAMGKPVWLLLRFVPDWRWIMNRDDTPWYPTMRLFRQTSPGDWQGAIRKVCDALILLMV